MIAFNADVSMALPISRNGTSAQKSGPATPGTALTRYPRSQSCLEETPKQLPALWEMKPVRKCCGFGSASSGRPTSLESVGYLRSASAHFGTLRTIASRWPTGTYPAKPRRVGRFAKAQEFYQQVPESEETRQALERLERLSRRLKEFMEKWADSEFRQERLGPAPRFRFGKASSEESF
jgi:hypothetical protein